MANINAITTRQGGLWVQPAGPNTAVYFLGCHDLGDVSEKTGSVELLRCMDRKGGWKTVGSLQSPPDAVSTSIDSVTFAVRDYLEKLSCQFTLFAMQRECGEPDLFTNYVRSVILNNARLTGVTDKNIVNHETETGSMKSYDIEAWPPVYRTGMLTARRQTTSETKDLNSVFSYTPVNCLEPCPTPGTTAIAVSDTSAYDEDVLRTLDGGATWTLLAGEPFVKGENVLSCVAFPMSNTVTRLLVAQAAVATNVGRISYSDDNGVTWTEVVFAPGINGLGVKGPHGLFASDQSHIWLASAKGYIYFSSNGGVTWTVQTSATLTVKDFYCISFSDVNNGMAGTAQDVFVYTTNGGTTWQLTAAVTGSGDDITAIDASGAYWWAGTSVGKLFYSKDTGATWTARQFTGYGTGAVKDVKFANELVGYMIWNSAAPVGTIFVTINGGYSWSAITTPPNSGLNDIGLADLNTIYAVGDVNTGTAVIIKATWD